ncbi:MAG: DUF6383 domain-containing protein [Dysgonamonadaceae bacterium]|jgi:hypothetical protein|nr:DUF6383 domain-containing protein [Dysgonamonadaceae bacterium]
MKRKLFTLLAAFMALATFQSNAQTGGVQPYDGESLFYLNVWSANKEVVRPSGFIDNFISPVRNESAKDYPVSADRTINGDATALQAMKYVFNRTFDKWELTNNNRIGTVGDVETYFTLTANTGDLTNTFAIRSASPTAKGDRIFFKGSNGTEYKDFVFLRFLQKNTQDALSYEYDGDNSVKPNTDINEKDSVGMVPWSVRYASPAEGGYLAANIFTGRNNGGTNDRSLYVVAYDTTSNTNGAPNNRYAIYSMDEVRNNWRDYRTNASLKRIVPVWVKAEQVGGRWANVTDFPDEFVQFREQGANNLLSIKSGNTTKNTFSVTRVDELNFGTFGSVAANTEIPPASISDVAGASNAVAGSAPVGDVSRLYKAPSSTDYVLQYFTISDPCDGKVVRVVRDPAYKEALLTGEGQFGNKLELRAPGEGFTEANGLNGAIAYERDRAQRFAIWINENGNMELYPLNSWTYITTEGKYKTNNPTSPGYNYAVWMDKPKASTADNGKDNFNTSFKIGQANGTPCTGPVVGSSTGYSNLELRPEKANLINQIDKNKYYFLQVTGRNVSGSNGGVYTSASAFRSDYKNETFVLDLVNDNGHKRVALTPMEKIRYAGAADGRYFDTPYDSINMSAHWRFEAIKEGDKVVGYNIINELNDTLKYDYDNLINVDVAKNAYIAEKPTVTGEYRTDLWQTVHLNCYEGSFKLRNMGGALSESERPRLANPYLDTLALGVVDANTNSYWYASTRGRQATGTTNEKSYLQKDVHLHGNSASAGLKFTLRAIDYEKSTHSDSGYEPAEDSLCTYLYKQGNYDIVEALSLNLRVDVGNGIDPTFGKNVAKMNVKSAGEPWLFVEPVYNAENNALSQYQYLIPPTYTESSTVYPNVDYMFTPEQIKGLKTYADYLDYAPLTEFLKSEGLTLDSYKWHYIKNAQGDYLVYDTINTTTGVITQQFGLKFAKVDRNNATPFRFYQPLVGDKQNENFILEFRVNKHDYAINRVGATPTISYLWDNEYATDNYGINSLLFPGQTSATDAAWLSGGGYVLNAIVTTLSDILAGNINSVAPADLLSLLQYIQQEHVARTKFAIIASGSDLLLSSWNDGHHNNSSVQAATRFKFSGPDMSDCPRDYVDSKYLIDNQFYANPTVKANKQNTEANPSTDTDKFLGKRADNNYANNNDLSASNLLITLADTLKAYTAGDQYNYGGSIGNQDPNRATPAFSGDRKGYISSLRQGYSWVSSALVVNDDAARYDRYRHYQNTTDVELYYIQNVANPKLYLTVDTSSVYSQTMMSTLNGVSGVKLIWKERFTTTSQNTTTVGETADYRPLQMFAIYGCKNGQAPYGNFILIPAASWEVNYTAPQKQTQILANANIGDGTITNEFRISDVFISDVAGSNYSIVMPSSENAPQGVTPTEYKFTSDPYFTGDFCHHNFVQSSAVGDEKVVVGNFVHSFTPTATTITAAKDYYDPSMHWEVKKVDGSNNLYTLTPESDKWDGYGEKVSERTQLLDKYYFVKVNDSISEYGGKIETFNAIPQYKPLNLVKLTITCITEKEGDACVSRFKKFEQDDLLLDWGILESVLTDRYIYSRGKADGSGYSGERADAFLGQAGGVDGSDKVQYLRIRESNYIDIDNGQDITKHHGVPYYNIIHVVVDPETKLEKEYYLEIKEGTVQFRALTEQEVKFITNFEQYPDEAASLKFCFPYKPVVKDDVENDSTTIGDKAYVNIAIRTMPQHNQVYWLAVNSAASNTTKAVKTADDADVFIFGPNIDGDEEWIGDASKEGWLKDFSRPSVYVVEPSGAEGVNYGLLSFASDVQPDINDGKFAFTMVYDTIVNKYAKTKVWFYTIQDQAGNYLTYAPETLGSSYHYGDYTYAYFTTKLDGEGSNINGTYKQTFGLQINKAGATSGHGFPFWVVAQVLSGEYKYLGQYNNRMVFIPSTSASKAVAQSKAMTFEIGKVDSGNFTGKPNVDGDGVVIYGVEGAVKVANATGAIELYTIDGRQFKSVVAAGGEQTISAPRGVVIVKVAGKATKVVVK